MENYTFSHRVTDISSLISVDSHGRVCSVRSVFFFTFTKHKKSFPFFLELQQPKRKKINSIKEKRKFCLFSFRVIPGRLISTCVSGDGNTSPDGNVTVDALPKLSSQVTFTFYFKLRIKLRRKVFRHCQKNNKIKTFWLFFPSSGGGGLKNDPS